MSTTSTSTTRPGLTLRRRFRAPPALVWRAWTEPQAVMRWWGPEGAEVVQAELDPRVGGRFRVVFTGPDGERHEVGGTYVEVTPEERLVFTWAWHSTPERESLVTVTLRAEGDETALTLTHERFFDEVARDRHREGWSGALDKLTQLFA
jgi:uncharacterized protein YndB with AHSA1/START domain